jgi:DNA-binding HxlR family transcriptional regulator
VRPEWKQIDDEQCRLFHASVELIGRRWSSAILLAMSRGAYRFSEIHASVPGLSDRMLARRLRELSAAEIVTRDVVPSTPVQVIYRLTPQGHELMAALQPLVRWGVRWHGEPGWHGEANRAEAKGAEAQRDAG